MKFKFLLGSLYLPFVQENDRLATFPCELIPNSFCNLSP